VIIVTLTITHDAEKIGSVLRRLRESAGTETGLDELTGDWIVTGYGYRPPHPEGAPDHPGCDGLERLTLRLVRSRDVAR
jgi:hypothetical protein